MRYKYLRFISALVLQLALIIVLVNVTGIVQPSVRTLAEMNSLSRDPYELIVHFDMIDDDYAMYYDSTVHTQRDKAKWNGKATVYFMNAFFYQDCHTILDGSICCKEWRDCWTKADFHSPVQMIEQWQSEAAGGSGEFYKIPVTASECGELLGSHYSGECYRVVLRNMELDWKGICDVNLDLSFGGQERFQSIPIADITLFYGTDDLMLKGIAISHEDEESWLSGEILVSPISESLEIDLSEYDIREDGLLSEEWEISIPQKNK